VKIDVELNYASIKFIISGTPYLGEMK